MSGELSAPFFTQAVNPRVSEMLPLFVNWTQRGKEKKEQLSNSQFRDSEDSHNLSLTLLSATQKLFLGLSKRMTKLQFPHLENEVQ